MKKELINPQESSLRLTVRREAVARLVGSCGQDPGHLEEVIDPYVEHTLISDLLYAVLEPVAGTTTMPRVDDRGSVHIES